MIVKHVGVWSVARMYALITGGIGLIIGICVALVSLIGVSIAGPNSSMPWAMPVFGVGAIVLFPILYGVMGLVAGAIGALLYNAAARIGGGVELDVQEQPISRPPCPRRGERVCRTRRRTTTGRR